MATPARRCTHQTTRNSQCKNKAHHIYNSEALCNLHLDLVKSREDCPICLSALDDPIEEKIQLTACGHYHHKKCLSMCPTPQCPTCRTPLTPADNLSIYRKTIFEPLAALLFAQPKEVQSIIVNSLSLMLGPPGQRTPPEFAIYDWAIKILSYSFDYHVPLEAISNLLSMNSAAIMHYHENGTFDGFEPQL